MLTNMRGVLSADPEVRTVTDPKTGNKMKVTDVFLLYQKDADSAKNKVRCVAWNEMAERLGKMKQGDEIEFAGNLTYNDYKHPAMDKPRKVLGFTILALDESKTLCEKMEQFMGVERRPTERPGTVFQPVRGRLLTDPDFATIHDQDGNPLSACRAVLRFWNGRRGEKNIYIPINAYGEAANQLCNMKKDDPIQFVGRLDSRMYTNDKMNHSHLELCYNVVSIDPERNLIRNTDAFLREQTGLRAHPLEEKIQDAEERKETEKPKRRTRAKAKEQEEPAL